MTTFQVDPVPPTVFIVDDDKAVCEALQGLFSSIGLKSRIYETAQAFLDDPHPDVVGCLVVDVRLPDRSGLDLHEELIRLGNNRPVIFMSGHADVAMSVRAMKAGAFEFLTKPVRHQDLLDAVQIANNADREQRCKAKLVADVAARIDTLTRREREIMGYVTEGYRNKEIAALAEVTEATVKLHRGHIMRKMEARSIADLIRLANLAAPEPKRPHSSTKV